MLIHRPISIKDTLLVAIGCLTLLIVLLVAHKTYESWKRLESTQELKQLALMNTQIFRAVVKLSEERGIVYIMLQAPDGDFAASLKPGLEQVRQETDSLLALASLKAERQPLSGKAALYGQIEKQLRIVEGLRRRVDRAFARPVAENRMLAEEWFAESTKLMGQLQDMALALYEDFADLNRTSTRHLRFNYLLSVITEYAGRERSFNGGLIVGKTAPTAEEQAKQWRWQGIVDLSWKLAGSLVDQGEVAAYFEEAKSHYYSSFDMMHNLVQPTDGGEVTYLISEAMWMQLAAEALDSLEELSEVSLGNALRFSEETERVAQRQIMLHILLLVFALCLCGYSFHVIISRVLRPVHRMADALYAVMKGKPVDFNIPETQREDEIGKLASVLVDYQANTEQVKRASAELARHAKALERSNKELDDFAYIASHDLKEPLRGLHNHSRFLLEDNEDKLDEESVNRLHRLTYLTQRMEKLINDLLYFSRLGRQDMAIKPTDLNEVIHDIETTLEHFLEERNGRIVIPEPLPVITCDQPRIAEVFRNLITNAVKYNDSREKTVEIGFLPAHPNSDGVMVENVLYVRDNGVGIAPEFNTEVFRIFKRLQSAKKGEEGTGVGLTFVKKIIERHGGAIWLESVPGQGTTFYFSLEGTVYARKNAA